MCFSVLVGKARDASPLEKMPRGHGLATYAMVVDVRAGGAKAASGIKGVRWETAWKGVTWPEAGVIVLLGSGSDPVARKTKARAVNTRPPVAI